MPAQIYTSNNTANSEKYELRKFWQVFLIILITISIPLGVIALKLFLDYRSRAGIDAQPEEVIVSNITDTSVTISFMTTGDPTKSSIEYGIEGEDTDESFFDLRSIDGTESFNMHYHKITNLTPGSKYTFTITLGNSTYPNEEIAFQNTFDTFETSSNIPTPSPVNGKIIADSYEDGVVYAHLTNGQKNSTVVSALVPESSGAYTVDLRGARNEDGSEFTDATNVVVFASIAGQGRGFVVGSASEQFMEDIEVDPTAVVYLPTGLGYVSGEVPTQIPTTPATTTPDITEEPTPATETPIPTSAPVATPTPTPVPTPTPIASGLEVTNYDDNDTIIPGAIIIGKGEPNTSIKIEIDGINIGSTFVSNEGNWQYALPEISGSGRRTLRVINEDVAIELSLMIDSLGDLPQTALSDYTIYFLALGVLVTGFGLNWWINKNKNWN